eukprot:Ihof_evm10s131 gene=Ihof_evmTU10s131
MSQPSLSPEGEKPVVKTEEDERDKTLTGAETFCSELVSLNSVEEVEKIIAVQTQIYSKFEKCNEKFTTFNDLCAANYTTTNQKFKRHTLLLQNTKSDLDDIFHRIRVLKTKLAAAYPEAYEL